MTDTTQAPERHKDRVRNRIINQCSGDLYGIISDFDPEISNLNNDVWDRLDKMAMEIEARSLDPSAIALRSAAEIRNEALEEAVQIAFYVSREGIFNRIGYTAGSDHIYQAGALQVYHEIMALKSCEPKPAENDTQSGLGVAEAAQALLNDDIALSHMAKAVHDGPLGADDYEFRADTKQGGWCLDVVRAALRALAGKDGA